jgi:hypothetical protein
MAVQNATSSPEGISHTVASVLTIFFQSSVNQEKNQWVDEKFKDAKMVIRSRISKDR